MINSVLPPSFMVHSVVMVYLVEGGCCVFVVHDIGHFLTSVIIVHHV